MGDTGSMIVGYILSILAIKFIGLDGPSLAGVQISSPQSLTLAVFIIPVADMIKVIMTRISLRKSPFKPDKLHIHYRWIDLGLKHMQTTMILLLINAVMVSGVLVFKNLGETILTILLISCTILLYLKDIILNLPGSGMLKKMIGCIPYRQFHRDEIYPNGLPDLFV